MVIGFLTSGDWFLEVPKVEAARPFKANVWNWHNVMFTRLCRPEAVTGQPRFIGRGYQGTLPLTNQVCY